MMKIALAFKNASISGIWANNSNLREPAFICEAISVFSSRGNGAESTEGEDGKVNLVPHLIRRIERLPVFWLYKQNALYYDSGCHHYFGAVFKLYDLKSPTVQIRESLRPNLPIDDQRN